MMAGTGAIKACRLCLGMDSELLAIDIQLENSMKCILGQNISYESGLPKYACDGCATFLGKFKKFRDKCLIAQTVLYNILKNTSQITDSELRKLNRKRLKLDLDVTPPSSPQKTPPQVEQPLETVKLEPSEFEMDFEDLEADSDDESPVTIEYLEEDLLDEVLNTENPLELQTREQTNTKVVIELEQEITLEAEEADLSEGFKISIPHVNKMNMKIKQANESSDSKDSLNHCDECCSSFANNEKFDECPHGVACPFSFDSFEEYRVHANIHRTFQCRRCSYSTTYIEEARAHRQHKHQDKYSCPYCEFRTLNTTAYQNHARCRHPNQLICYVCGSCFDSYRGLKSHRSHEHKEKNTPTSKAQKMSVSRVACAEPEFLCAACGIQFSTRGAWRRHLDNGHYVEVSSKRSRYYPLQNMKEAFEAVTSKGMTIRRAAVIYKVPRSSLSHAVKNGCLRHKRGPSPIFGEEEQILVDYVVKKGSLKPISLINKAKQIAKLTKREHCFKNGTPGLSWYNCFMRRHPELKQYFKDN